MPIIEPVRTRLSGLKKALDTLSEVDAKAILITNPQVGDFKDDPSDLTKFFSEYCGHKENVSQGFILSEKTSIDAAIKLCNGLIKTLHSFTMVLLRLRVLPIVLTGMEESRLIYLSKIAVENFTENILGIIKTEF